MPVDKPDGSPVKMLSDFRWARQKPAGGLLPNFFRVKKADLRIAILAQLQRELATQVSAAHLARDEAISEESRAENKYDTHSQEAAYLAEGQARLAGEIEASLAHYASLPLPDFTPDQAIALGALVEVSSGAGRTWYFLGPRAGGMEVQLDGHAVLVVTPQSPLGRQLLGKRMGDALPAPTRAGPPLQIVSLA
jgi:transcription elongation GreA/GreB family factor